MRSVSRRNRGVLTLVAAAAATALIAGCGGSDNSSSSPTTLSLKISEKGQKASYQVPKSAPGGLVAVNLTNQGEAPHGVQFIQYTGGHGENDVLKQLGSNSNKIPSWIKLWGGIGSVPPGATDTADVNLPAGNYVLADAAAFSGPSNGPPATAPLKVTAGTSGDLPSTPATVTAANPAKDKFKWEISGLTTGSNRVTFNSKGKEAVHLILAVPVKGKAPPLSQIKKDLASNGPPPPYADAQDAQSTAILDGGASQTASLDLKKPGQYIFFCPLTDRDGGKPHFEEGLLKVQTVN
ncbi:MAG: hypothetical protein ACRDLL_09280 [Solirubrobacterales bacterium]